MSSQNSQVVKYLLPNLSSNVCSEEFDLHLSEVSVSDLSRLLISRPDVCVCSDNLISFLQNSASKLRGEQVFGPSTMEICDDTKNGHRR